MMDIAVYLDEKDITNYAFFAATQHGDNLFFSDFNSNALFKLNLLSGVTEIVGFFPEHDLHWVAFNQPDSIWFLPAGAVKKRICIYKFSEQAFTYMNLPGTDDRENRYANFIIDDSYVWIIPCRDNLLLRINRANEQLEIVTEMPQNTINGKTVNFGDAIIINGAIYCCPFEYENILKYNIESSTFSEIHWQHDLMHYQKMLYFEGFIYYIPNRSGDMIVRHNVAGDQIEDWFKLQIDGTSDWFCGFAQQDDTVWIMPNGGAFGAKVCLTNKTIERICFIDKSHSTQPVHVNSYIPITLSDGGVLFPPTDVRNPIVYIDAYQNINLLHMKGNPRNFLCVLKQHIDCIGKSGSRKSKILYEC